MGKQHKSTHTDELVTEWMSKERESFENNFDVECVCHTCAQQFAKDMSLLIGTKTVKLTLEFISSHFILPIKLSL